MRRRRCGSRRASPHLIEPFGFAFDPVRLRRVGLDYVGRAEVRRHASWPAFSRWRDERSRRLVLLTTRARVAHHDAAFAAGDVLLGGRESTGVPDAVHEAADLRVRVPMVPACRSLNLVSALALVLGEALRQTGGFPRNP